MNPHDNVRPKYDPNALVDFQHYQQVKKDATHTAIHVLAMSPDGVIDATQATALTVWTHPFKGSVFLVGLITLPLIAFWFIWSLIVGAFAPARIAETAPVSQRMGNAVGRLTHGVATASWEVAKPGLGVAFASYYAGQSANVNSQSTPAQTLPGVVQVSSLGNATNQTQNTGLSEEQKRAIEGFLK